MPGTLSSKTLGLLSISKIDLTKEYPFVCNPLDGKAIKISLSETFLGVIKRSRLTVPTINPTKS